MTRGRPTWTIPKRPSHQHRVAFGWLCLIVISLSLSWVGQVEGFSLPSKCSVQSYVGKRHDMRLQYHDNQEEKESSSSPSSSSSNKDSQKTTTTSLLERLNIAGVSVCADPPGFFLLLESGKGSLPLQVTSDVQDAYVTTTPQALTMIQLLSGVDMAGPILPPETLAKLLVLSCESIPEPFLDESQHQVLQFVQQSLRKVRAATNMEESSPSSNLLLYSETHPWLQSKCQLPQVTLDELVLTYRESPSLDGDGPAPSTTTTTTTTPQLSDPSRWQCQLRCNVKGIGGMSVSITSDLIQAVSYQYDAMTSNLFTCLTLALRYKAPISWQRQGQLQFSEDESMEENPPIHSPSLVYLYDEEELEQLFPKRTTVTKLKQSSTRVTNNIERGFEIHKLQKALEIARKRGDVQAEAKIRAVLDEMDSFQELPVTTQDEKNVRKSPTDDEVDDSSFQ